MENNRAVRMILVIMGMLLVSPFFVFAYSDETTHPALTGETVTFFNTQYPNLQLNDSEKEILMRGSVDEDKGTRPLQHFYDPVFDRGITMFSIEWQKSKEWAEDTLAQAVYSFNFISNPTERALYGTIREFFGSDTDHSWERAIYEYVWGDKGRGLESLGHVLHLIQDASVPDHTRNDPHPPAFEMGSPYEAWTKQFGPENINMTGKLSYKKPISYESLEDYFDSLARYSNNNFFSKDTIFSKEYKEPNMSYEWYESLSNGEWYKFGYKNTEGEQYRLVLLGKRHIGFDEQILDIEDYDDLILTDYWNLLSQQAVLHGAGVMKLFFDEVEKERETKVLYNKNKNWFQKLFDSTQKDIYQTATALYGGSVPYDEIESGAEGAQQASVVVVAIQEDESLTEELPGPILQSEEEIEVPDALTDTSVTVNTPAAADVTENTNTVDLKTYNATPNPYQPGFGGGGGVPDAPQNDTEETPPVEEEEEEELPPVPIAPNAPIVTSPASDSLAATTTLTFSGTASSTLIISNDFNGATTTADENENWTIELADFPEGETIVRFIATNADGLTATSSGITVTVDTTPPTIDSFTVLQCVYSLTASTCLSGGTALNLSIVSAASDISYISLIADGVILATTTELSGILTVSGDGIYDVQVAAYDVAGNGATSTAKSVMVLTTTLVINEIAWGGTTASPSDEWVELYNPSAYDITLSNISLVAADGAPDIELLNTATSSEFYLIERTDSTTTSVAEDLAIAFSGAGGSSGLSNGGEVLRLLQYLGGFATTTLDETPALSDCGGTWCAGDNDTKQTMERVSATAAGTLASNWKSNNTFTKNGTDAGGNDIIGTPRAKNSVSLMTIGYFCLPETSSFIEGGYYIPGSGQCTYTYTNVPANWYGDSYRGVVASSTIVNGHSLGASPSSEQGDDISNPVQGEQLFTAIYKVRTGPIFNDLAEFRAFFETGANSPPHLDYGVLNWLYGTAP